MVISCSNIAATSSHSHLSDDRWRWPRSGEWPTCGWQKDNNHCTWLDRSAFSASSFQWHPSLLFLLTIIGRHEEPQSRVFAGCVPRLCIASTSSRLSVMMSLMALTLLRTEHAFSHLIVIEHKSADRWADRSAAVLPWSQPCCPRAATGRWAAVRRRCRAGRCSLDHSRNAKIATYMLAGTSQKVQLHTRWLTDSKQSLCKWYLDWFSSFSISSMPPTYSSNILQVYSASNSGAKYFVATVSWMLSHFHIMERQWTRIKDDVMIRRVRWVAASGSKMLTMIGGLFQMRVVVRWSAVDKISTGREHRAVSLR